jgi:hypothetical protein
MRVRLTEHIGEEPVTLKRAGGWDVRRADIIAAMCQVVREGVAGLAAGINKGYGRVRSYTVSGG